jgi:hypothetical protein
MVYNTKNYWVLGPCPSFGIVETRKLSVSEIGSVGFLRWGTEISTLLGPLEAPNLNHWCDKKVKLSLYLTN